MAAGDRRLLIIEAARESFAEGGYHRTSLDAVAARAGVSKALIYEHFSSKRELHAAMLEQHVKELVGRLNAALAGAEPGQARMRAGLEAFFTFLDERRGTAAILLRNTGDPDVAEWLARLRDEVAAAIVTLMTAEVEQVITDDPDLSRTIQMVAQQQIGAIQSLADWWGEHREVSKEQVVATAMEFGWVGLERLSSGERWAGGA
ncbi:MAG: TetR/AcrR family transcriptional regulator [Actinomycetota bacterium]|nr:TetR/AcrR family transcriptional regulator [Actinomycetota bacterium]